MSATPQIGVAGLAVMGENLALNVESRGDRALMEEKTAEILALLEVDARPLG